MALSGNFSPSRIWVKIPPSAVKVVVFNNSCLGLIFLEAEGVGLSAFREAIEFPNPDFTAFARACGGQGFKASHPDELHGAIADAFAVDGPRLWIASRCRTNCPIFRISTSIWPKTMRSLRSRRP